MSTEIATILAKVLMQSHHVKYEHSYDGDIVHSLAMPFHTMLHDDDCRVVAAIMSTGPIFSTADPVVLEKGKDSGFRTWNLLKGAVLFPMESLRKIQGYEALLKEPELIADDLKSVEMFIRKHVNLQFEFTGFRITMAFVSPELTIVENFRVPVSGISGAGVAINFQFAVPCESESMWALQAETDFERARSALSFAAMSGMSPPQNVKVKKGGQIEMPEEEIDVDNSGVSYEEFIANLTNKK